MSSCRCSSTYLPGKSPCCSSAIAFASARLSSSSPFRSLCFQLLFAQGTGDDKLAEVKSQYTKYEYRIPMRDGKRLFTAVYVPKDQSQTYPILLTRTPYSVKPYGADQYRDTPGPSSLFAKAGYIFAFQDVRGRWMSEGEFVNMRPHNPAKKGPADIDESSDTYDTIDWLLKHVPNHNGKVGLWGISYPGFYTAAGMIDAHPGAQGRLAAGPRHRLVRRRRLAPQRRADSRRTCSTSCPASTARGPSRRRSSARRSISKRPTATSSS